MSRKRTSLSVPVAHSGDSVSRIRDCGDSVSTIEPGAGRVKTQRRSQQDALPESKAYQDLLRNLTAAIAPLQAFHQQAAEIYEPTVREILRSGRRDARLIEQTLDHLLDHACIPQGLALFKSLCRYYWELNPQATASYINAYREMWDSDDKYDPEVKP